MYTVKPVYVLIDPLFTDTSSRPRQQCFIILHSVLTYIKMDMQPAQNLDPFYMA